MVCDTPRSPRPPGANSPTPKSPGRSPIRQSFGKVVEEGERAMIVNSYYGPARGLRHQLRGRCLAAAHSANAR